MDEERISIATHPDLEGLPRTDRDHPDVDAGLLPEQWDDMPEEAGLLRRGR